MEKNEKGVKTQSKKLKKPSKPSPGVNQRLVEYSDVSSIELSGPESAPEAGELPSDGLSIVSDDENSTIGTSTNINNNNSIYEPIDDDDDEMEKLMVGDGFSDTFNDFNKRSKELGKKSKKQKKVKKSKKRKKSERGKRGKKKKSSEDSVEEISDDETLLSSDDGDKNDKRIEESATPPLDTISYTPKNKYEAYTPISPGNTCLSLSNLLLC